MSRRPKLARNAHNAMLSLAFKAQYASSLAVDEVPYTLSVIEYNDFLAVNGSDSGIEILDSVTLQLQHRVAGSTKDAERLTSIGTIGPKGQQLLISSFANGRVSLRDARSADDGVLFKGSNAAPSICTASSSSSTYVAVGSELFQHEAVVRIHDIRQPGKPIHAYTETHSDDVSTLAFHPEQDHMLLTGSVDGLTSTMDTRIADEDDAILHTANIGASLSKVGWTSLPGKPMGGVFALTNMETLSIYDATDEMSTVCEFGDLREVSLPEWETHYVIDCIDTGAGLAISAGTREGGLAVLRAPLDGDWSLEQTLTQNGHTDIVRGTWLDLATGFVASCSEDGHVCLWSKQASVSHETEVSQNPAPLKALRDSQTRAARFTPY